ncbi:hypothetical protein PPACK8108_LOCUS10667 [Phakopsora pachyrhizi]|uniref:Reverse transcriptase domain-containing protein n=1 Tax=Phakopsora pachyrhizi TaxID=170000 RepID=A0AAV0B3T2_PHAPC|nr:hypothetical protein PPACK8108_LOCUS10667 [Phakopsora pachyrhizi]
MIPVNRTKKFLESTLQALRLSFLSSQMDIDLISSITPLAWIFEPLAIEELGSLQQSLSDYHTEDLLQVNEDEIHDCSDPVSILRPSMLDEDQGLSSQPLKNTSKSVTNQLVDKLIAEWETEPLIEPIPVTTQSLLCPPIIIGIPDIRPNILYGEPALRFTELLEDEATINLNDIRTFTNLASINFTGLIGDKHVKL